MDQLIYSPLFPHPLLVQSTHTSKKTTSRIYGSSYTLCHMQDAVYLRTVRKSLSPVSASLNKTYTFPFFETESHIAQDRLITSSGKREMEDANFLESHAAISVVVDESHSTPVVDSPGKPEVSAAENGKYGEDFNAAAPKHVFVLSSAGKPVFSLSGDEQHLSTLTGLIQGLISICDDCDGDELESISASDRRFVFLRRGDLVLVAVSAASSAPLDSTPKDGCNNGDVVGKVGGKEGDVESPECESFLRLQLEYMYATILFFLTSKVQTIFRRSPGYDLRELLGGAESSLRGVIDLAEPQRGRGRMLMGGVETVWMDPAIRARVARALQATQEAAASSALYAIWLCDEKLVSLAQPRAPSHRLHSRDLLLIANFVATQPALRNAESWTPVCFPRFQDKGHLYAYIAFLKDPSEPMAQNDPAQSQTSADEMRGRFGSGSTTTGENVDTDESNRCIESCVILVSVEASSEQFQAFRRARTALESRFRAALGLHWDRYLGAGAAIEREGILKKFSTQLNALHFFYCLRGRRGGAPCVTQCLSPPFVSCAADDPVAQRRIWGHYVRAALRLRRGSSQEGRVSCRSGREEVAFGGDGGSSNRRDQKLPEPERATELFESDPVHSLTYEISSKETVVSLFGQGARGSGGGGGGGLWASPSSAGGSWNERDELHACFPSSVAPETAYKSAVRLMAIIRRDRDWLFLMGTGASK